MKRGLLLAGALALGACAHRPSVALPELHRALSLPAVGPVPYTPNAVDGKVVMIDFFATWCFPCVADLPHLEELQKRYGPRGFTVIAVGMDLDGRKMLEPFAAYYELPFPILVASDDIREGRSAFGRIRILPSTVLLDRAGTVLASYEGVADLAELERVIDRALGD